MAETVKNYKPYRTKAQKEEARRTARKCEDGAWRSNAPVSYHSEREKQVKQEEE